MPCSEQVRAEERRAARERAQVREAHQGREDRERRARRRQERREEEEEGEQEAASRARGREQERERAEGAVRAARAVPEAAAERLLEAREVPVGGGKETEVHVSGSQERRAVSGYFDKLERADKYKHKLAVSVIHKEEALRPAVKAWADGTDRRDERRDNAWFDKIARFARLGGREWEGRGEEGGDRRCVLCGGAGGKRVRFVCARSRFLVICSGGLFFMFNIYVVYWNSYKFKMCVSFHQCPKGVLFPSEVSVRGGREDEKKAERARDRRAQHRKDERSLDFYEAVDKTLERGKGASTRSAVATPKAYREWEHAESAMGLKKGGEAVLHATERAAPRHGPPPGAQAAPRLPQRKTRRASASRLSELAVPAALQAQIKAAIRKTIKRDVTPVVDKAVATDIDKGLRRAAAASAGPAIAAAAMPAPGASPVASASRTGESTPSAGAGKEFKAPVVAAVVAGGSAASSAKTGSQQAGSARQQAVGYKSEYDYQKQHLAKVLDRGEPSAKKQLNQFLHDPLSAVESLF